MGVKGGGGLPAAHLSGTWPALAQMPHSRSMDERSSPRPCHTGRVCITGKQHRLADGQPGRRGGGQGNALADRADGPLRQGLTLNTLIKSFVCSVLVQEGLLLLTMRRLRASSRCMLGSAMALICGPAPSHQDIARADGAFGCLRVASTIGNSTLRICREEMRCSTLSSSGPVDAKTRYPI